MNGNWFSYGLEPIRFITEYKRVVNLIRFVTNRVAFVWAPNAANNYPFDASLPSNAADATALDTNGNGKLDPSDDPFTPYWPGADLVDWVGISLYWKGNPNTQFPLHDNSAPPADIWSQMVDGGPFGSSTAFPFYTMFAKTYNIPLVMAEGAAAFALAQGPSNVTVPAGDGRTNILQTFWRSYLSSSFFSTFSKAKMFINFEQVKKFVKKDSISTLNNGVTRDYRITWDPPTLAAFQADIKVISNNLQWAVPFVPGMDPLTIGGGQTAQNGRSFSGGVGSSSSTANSHSGVTRHTESVQILVTIFFYVTILSI
ncbi:hypothetical protein HK100_006928 [Physocladia obscura]|uniref:GH26 domain-containing protein n=1 Tax=Physocladia obscura TaxID=109957 RepID=A0AAD5SRL9_9FUNG|nr:hypothetical protein HK100_006928 [Physocladia obscura]